MRKLAFGALVLSFVGFGSAAWGLQYDIFYDVTDDANDGAFGQSLDNVALGSLSLATGESSTATGYKSQATGSLSAAYGAASVASGYYSTAIGQDSSASGDYSTVIGQHSSASGYDSTALGERSIAKGDNSLATGQFSRAFGAGSTALGENSTASGAGSVALGQGSKATEADTVSVGTSTYQRRIVNVADGVADSDAATVGQLKRATTDLSDLEGRVTVAEAGIAANAGALVAETTARQNADTALQGNIDTEAAARAAADGVLQSNLDGEATARQNADTALQGNIDTEAAARIAADSVMRTDIGVLQDQTLGTSWTTGSNDVAASATGSGSTALGSGASARTRDTAIGSNATVTADGSVALGADTTVASENSVAVGADSSVAADAAGGVALGQNASVASGATGSVALGQNSVADEADTVSVGSTGNARRVTNVAAAINDTDAVNLEQLRQVEANLQVDVGGIYNRLDKLESRLDDVGALAAAFSALVPNARAAGNTQISIGYGNYGSANALAAGMFHYVNNSVLLNAGVSTAFDRHETAARAGITLGW